MEQVINSALQSRGKGPVILWRDEDIALVLADFLGPGVDGCVAVCVFGQRERLLGWDETVLRGDGERVVGKVDHCECCVWELGQDRVDN
jgi:hypothetical protein